LVMATQLHLETLSLTPGTEQDININLLPEERSVVHGIVRLPDGTPAQDAAVKLFYEDPNTGELIPVAFAFTDQLGQFLFGIENPLLTYRVKVFHYVPENAIPPGTGA